jgi:RNA polymerase sigma-70 factor (ECF subfamily)
MAFAFTAPEIQPESIVQPAVEASWSDFYEQHFEFVWRSLRRLGVPQASVDDATQEVFIVAFRREGEFEGRSSVKSWLFGIALFVARRSARTASRRRAEELPECLVDSRGLNPQESAARTEAIRALYRVLDELDADKRAVFVMAELEQMTAPEIAEATQTPLNTVYSRLRMARMDFDKALARHRARDEWRQR